MPARERQTRRKKSVRQLLCGRPTAQPGTPFQPGIPGGAETAAGLVRGFVFRRGRLFLLVGRSGARLCQQRHVDPKKRRTVIISSKNNTEKILSSINNHVMILTTLFIILFTTRRGCDGNSKRSFDPSYR